MFRKIFLSFVAFFFVSGVSYAGNLSSHVDFELGLTAMYTITADDEIDVMEGKFGEGLELGVYAEVVNGLRLGGGFEFYYINVDETEDYFTFDNMSIWQINLGAEYAFVEFDSSALYAKLALGVYGDPDFKFKVKDQEIEVDSDVELKQPNLYVGIGWFFSDIAGNFMKNFGSKVELGYKMTKLDSDGEKESFSGLRLKGSFIYSIR